MNNTQKKIERLRQQLTMMEGVSSATSDTLLIFLKSCVNCLNDINERLFQLEQNNKYMQYGISYPISNKSNQPEVVDMKMNDIWAKEAEKEADALIAEMDTPKEKVDIEFETNFKDEINQIIKSKNNQKSPPPSSKVDSYRPSEPWYDSI